MIKLADDADEEVSKRQVENALGDVISAFDGFGRKCCKVNAPNAANPKRAQRISFQDIRSARTEVRDLFGFDFAQRIDDLDWLFVMKQFQKRHLLAHTMGIIDDDYVKKTETSRQNLGRKVSISDENVLMLSTLLIALASELFIGVT